MPFLGASTLADLSPLSERWASLNGPAEELVSTILAKRRSTIGIAAESCANVVLSASSDDGSIDRVTKPVEPFGLVQYSQLGYVDALLALVTGAVAGLAHAHQRGIIHRDLKPANILVSDDGNPVLLDFNLAVASHEAKTRIVGGTLPYMSPQQLASLETGEAATSSDDVFSIGVILYELLSGHLPFDCPKVGEGFTLQHVIASRRLAPPDIRLRNAHVSLGLADIVSKCVAPLRSERYQDATELLDDLNRHRQYRLLKWAPNRSIRERLAKWSTRHPRIASASTVASLAAMLLLLCSLMIYQRGQRIAKLGAQTKLQQFQSEVPTVITALSTPGRETEILSDGLAQASNLMSSWIDLPKQNWQVDSGRPFPKQQDTRRTLISTFAIGVSVGGRGGRHGYPVGPRLRDASPAPNKCVEVEQTVSRL
jgi:serine/threonine protein kinase